MNVRLWAYLALFILALPISAFARGLDLRPEVSLELRVFPDDSRSDDQLETTQAGLVLTGEASWRSGNRRTRFDFEPYLRLDSEDARRSYVDIRELSLSHDFGDWDVVLGISQVFWGVAESRNVVDVINQFDAIEDVDEGEKLGQPMIRASRRLGPGNIELFYLPYFRERRFAGESGRLRFQPVVDDDGVGFERSGDEWAGDWAARYTQRSGDVDVGLHVFHGTSRNPFLTPSPNGDRLLQTYQSLDQVGADMQYTKDAWLLKGEFVRAEVGEDRFSSAVFGFEYTFFGLGGSSSDLGFIGEYLYDDRDLSRVPVTVFDNDVFAGLRLTLNDTQDTELLAGVIADDETGATQASVEFQRRIGARQVLEFEARVFAASGDPLIEVFESDDYLTLRWTGYF